MTKRARYDGPYESVVVAVANQGDVYLEKHVTVTRGGLLPTETEDGTPVPAAVRDDLIKNNPDFSEVNQADGRSSSPVADKSTAKDGE
jgi:hypothetical protein